MHILSICFKNLMHVSTCPLLWYWYNDDDDDDDNDDDDDDSICSIFCFFVEF